MANKTLFQAVQTRNAAGGAAYTRSDREALAQLATTGTLHDTFYTSADVELDTLLQIAQRVLKTDPEFVAKVAVYARQRGGMKDTPALLWALLTVEHGELAERIFDDIVDTGKMLKNVVHMLRSGKVGRRSLGNRPKRLVRRWLRTRSDTEVFAASVGGSPSLADVIRLVHPRPTSPSRRALYGYLLGREVDTADLPDVVKAFEAFKAARARGEAGLLPDVPFRLLTALELSTAHWSTIAQNASWTMTRMNLNTFLRHGVLDDPNMVALIAARLRDPGCIKRARAFPYHLMVAWKHAADHMPQPILDALEDAMEIALNNVPRLDGEVAICVDISGSMHAPITGYRRGGRSAVQCNQVAALFAAALRRRNPRARVLPFHTEVVPTKLSKRDSVMRIAKQLSELPSGGTSVSAPLEYLRKKGVHPDLVVIVSDNESWADTARGRDTKTWKAWHALKKQNPNAQLVCLDLTPNVTVQAKPGAGVLHVGGFSDAVFDAVRRFQKGITKQWVEDVNAIDIRAADMRAA